MDSIQPIYFILCDDVRLEINGKVSIIGEYSLVDAPVLPITLTLCVITKWAGNPGASGVVGLQMIPPNSKVPVPIGEQPFSFDDVPYEFAHAGTVNKFPWQFHSTGVYNICVLLDGVEKGRIQLLIRHSESDVSNESNTYSIN